MIFITDRDKPLIHLMLLESDLSTLRSGLTMFVRPEMTGGKVFDHVVISLHSSVQAIYDLMKRAGHEVDPSGLVSPSLTPEEEICEGCGGIMPAHQINHGRCIVCWRKLAIGNLGRIN